MRNYVFAYFTRKDEMSRLFRLDIEIIKSVNLIR